MATTPAREPLVLATWDGRKRRSRRFQHARVTVGSADDVDLLVEGAAPSHGTFEWEPDGWYFRSLDDDRTLLNAHPLHAERTLLREGNMLRIADTTLTVLDAHGHGRVVPLRGEDGAGAGDVLRVGRAMDNDVVIDDPGVASYHLELWQSDQGLVVRDVGGHGRTSVDGQPAAQGTLEPGSKLSLGGVTHAAEELIQGAGARPAAPDPGAPLLAGKRLNRLVDNHRPILRDADVAIRHGQFLAIAGTSGAGKSTLMKLLNGYDRPSSGVLRVSGDPRQTVGYVPQDDILHRELTLRDAVVLSATLRYPPGTAANEVERRADELFVQLGLHEHAHTRVSSLSGGQRKRASVALELMTRPELLLLDEPSSGLDPATDLHLMQLLRSLADAGYGIVLITHSTLDISVCDKVLFLAPGGFVVYHGSVPDALEHFGVGSIELVYEKLEEELAPAQWRSRFEASPAFTQLQTEVEACLQRLAPAGDAERPETRAGVLRTDLWQLQIATARYAKTLMGDRRNLVFLLAQVPVILGLSRLIFGGRVLTTPISAAPSAGALLSAPALDGLQLLFLLGATIVWLGTINAAREICKETSIWERERHVGFRPLPYLGSKLAVLGFLALAQMIVLVAMVALMWSLPTGGLGLVLQLFGVALLVAMAATSMGLLISAATATPDRAMTIAPVVMIPQLLFGGVMVGLSSMGAVPRAISNVILGRWAFEALSLSTSRRSFLTPDVLGRYSLNTSLTRPMVALAVLWAVFTIGAAIVLVTRDRTATRD